MFGTKSAFRLRFGFRRDPRQCGKRIYDFTGCEKHRFRDGCSEDENGKTNLSIRDISGSILLVSQFTLYANTKRGNRPSFIDAGDPAHAEKLYEYFMQRIREEGIPLQHGKFGADMQVQLINDGPFTILYDSDTL